MPEYDIKVERVKITVPDEDDRVKVQMRLDAAETTQIVEEPTDEVFIVNATPTSVAAMRDDEKITEVQTVGN